MESEAAGRLRGLLAAHKRVEDLITIGAHVPGTDPRFDEARAKLDRIEGFLCQSVDADYSRDEALSDLLRLTNVSAAPPPPAPEPGPVPTGAVPTGGLTGAFAPLPAGAEVVPG